MVDKLSEAIRQDTKRSQLRIIFDNGVEERRLFSESELKGYFEIYKLLQDPKILMVEIPDVQGTFFIDRIPPADTKEMSDIDYKLSVYPEDCDCVLRLIFDDGHTEIQASEVKSINRHLDGIFKNHSVIVVQNYTLDSEQRVVLSGYKVKPI